MFVGSTFVVAYYYLSTSGLVRGRPGPLRLAVLAYMWMLLASSGEATPDFSFGSADSWDSFIKKSLIDAAVVFCTGILKRLLGNVLSFNGLGLCRSASSLSLTAMQLYRRKRASWYWNR